MLRKIFSHNIHTKEILLTLAKVGMFTIAATSPYFLHNIIKHYFRNISERELRIKAQRLRSLQKRKIISFQELKDKNIKITLSHLGKTIVRHFKLDEMKLQKPSRWDGFWRIVMYDIPVHQKKASDAFRQKLKQMGLYQLQKSVWISPFDCLAELEFLCAVFGLEIADAIYYFKSTEIPKIKEVKEFFNL